MAAAWIGCSSDSGSERLQRFYVSSYLIWNGLKGLEMAWYGLIWLDMDWNGLIWLDIGKSTSGYKWIIDVSPCLTCRISTAWFARAVQVSTGPQQSFQRFGQAKPQMIQGTCGHVCYLRHLKTTSSSKTKECIQNLHFQINSSPQDISKSSLPKKTSNFRCPAPGNVAAICKGVAPSA